MAGMSRPYLQISRDRLADLATLPWQGYDRVPRSLVAMVTRSYGTSTRQPIYGSILPDATAASQHRWLHYRELAALHGMPMHWKIELRTDAEYRQAVCAIGEVWSPFSALRTLWAARTTISDYYRCNHRYELAVRCLQQWSQPVDDRRYTTQDFDLGR